MALRPLLSPWQVQTLTTATTAPRQPQPLGEAGSSVTQGSKPAGVVAKGCPATWGLESFPPAHCSRLSGLALACLLGRPAGQCCPQGFPKEEEGRGGETTLSYMAAQAAGERADAPTSPMSEGASSCATQPALLCSRGPGS